MKRADRSYGGFTLVDDEEADSRRALCRDRVAFVELTLLHRARETLHLGLAQIGEERDLPDEFFWCWHRGGFYAAAVTVTSA